MRSQYLIPLLLGFFLLGALGWLIWTPYGEALPHPGLGESEARSGGRGVMSTGSMPRRTPFLASHEQVLSFEPGKENIAPSFHIELEALQQQLEQAPQDTTALIRMARLKQDGHQLEEAVDYYRQYLALHSQSRQAWLDLALCYGEIQRWEEALEATQETLVLFPDDPGALYNLGAIYANTGRLEEARTAWQRVAKLQESPAMQALAEDAMQRLGTLQP